MTQLSDFCDAIERDPAAVAAALRLWSACRSVEGSPLRVYIPTWEVSRADVGSKSEGRQ